MISILHPRPPTTLDGAKCFYFTTFRDVVWAAQSAAAQCRSPQPSAVDVLTTAMETLARRGSLRFPSGTTARELASRAVDPAQPGIELDLSPIVEDLARSWVAPPAIPKA